MRFLHDSLGVVLATIIATSSFNSEFSEAKAFLPATQKNCIRTHSSSSLVNNNDSITILTILRGGATAVDLDEYDEYDEYDEEEEEEEEPVVVKKSSSLTKSTLKSTQKIKQNTKTQATKKSKDVVNSSLSMKKKKKISLLKALHVPYIIRAGLNPVTFIQMTKAYFASLFNINYLQAHEESSDGLRSALEAKARREAAAGTSRKGKKTMKPGRSKSLSDLPPINA